MKKIRITVPEDIWRLMKNDTEDFGINNNKLCNYLLKKLKYKKRNRRREASRNTGQTFKKNNAVRSEYCQRRSLL